MQKEGLQEIESYPQNWMSIEEIKEYSISTCASADFSGLFIKVLGKVLTERQKRILELYAEGYSLREIGRRLRISEALVRLEMKKIRQAYRPACD